jgi:hypothetical protein
MTWRNILLCGWLKIKWINNKNGWKIKTDERIKWMNKKKDEHNLFTTKNYVSIQTLHVYNWEVCVNWNTTCLQSRGMCQSKHHMFISKRYVLIRDWNNMRLHIFYTILTCFLLEFNLSEPLMSRNILTTWIIKLHCFPFSTKTA